jgi:hypothetical protein
MLTVVSWYLSNVNVHVLKPREKSEDSLPSVPKEDINSRRPGTDHTNLSHDSYSFISICLAKSKASRLTIISTSS